MSAFRGLARGKVKRCSMSRKTARKKAFKLVFQTSFFDNSEAEKIAQYFFAENFVDEEDKQFISDIVCGVYENLDEIDTVIEKHVDGWELGRLDRVDLAIMRVCVFEILNMNNGTPTSVSINEAVETAKTYGSDDSPAFINATLRCLRDEYEAGK